MNLKENKIYLLKNYRANAYIKQRLPMGKCPMNLYLSVVENRMLQRNFLSVPKSGYVLLRKEEFRDVMTFQGIPACSIFSNAAETEKHLQRKVTRCNSGEYHSCRLAKLVNFSKCIGRTKTERMRIQSLFHFMQFLPSAR